MKIIGGIILILIGLLGLLFVSSDNSAMTSAIFSGQRGASVGLAGSNENLYKLIFFLAAIVSGASTIFQGLNTKKCNSCQSEIPKNATKCPHCTSDIFNQSDSNLSGSSKEKINSSENKIQSEDLENPDSPLINEKRQKTEHLINKLNKLGYKLLNSKITEASEYWEFEFSSNGMKFEIYSIEELEKFAKNFR